jgi:hypothetical protein
MARGERKMKNKLQRIKEYVRAKGKRKRNLGFRNILKPRQRQFARLCDLPPPKKDQVLLLVWNVRGQVSPA